MSLLDLPGVRAELLLCMRASLCAYDISELQARRDFEALGFVYVGLAQVPGRWVYVCRRDGWNWIIGQGTRVTANFDPEELWDDVWLLPTRTPYGLAPDGFYDPLQSLLHDIKSMVDPALPVILTGHSLGGESALLLASEFPGCRCYPISNPTGTSREYLHAIKAERLVPYTRDRDFAHGWGVGLSFHQQLPFLWRSTAGIAEVTSRSTIFNLSLQDHSLEGSIAAESALLVPAGHA